MSKFCKQFDEFNLEIERLTRELDQAISEKVQSAKYGLALLEEKCHFQDKCVQLEILYENTKQELETVRIALNKIQVSQKVTTENSIQHEDALLNESAAMESSFTIQVLELENEIKYLRKELERVVYERDTLFYKNTEVLREKCDLEDEKCQIKIEFKELKVKEANLSVKYSELENENKILRKQLSIVNDLEENLEKTQNEIKCLEKENLMLKGNIEEFKKSQHVIELRLEDAMEALEIEREAKAALKKELSMFNGTESIYKSKSLAESITEIKESIDFNSNRSKNLYSESVDILKESKDEKHIQQDQLNSLKLRSDLVHLQKDFMHALKYEIKNLKLKMFDLDSEDQYQLSETIQNLKDAQQSLTTLNNELVELCREFCHTKDKSTASKNMENESDSNDDSQSTICSERGSSEDCELFMCSVEIKKYANLSNDHLKYLKVAVQNTHSHERENSNTNKSSNIVVQLLKQNNKLENLLSKKRKQITTLQCNSKNNHRIAETALKNIRTKYEKEKVVVADTVRGLVREIKTLKDEATAFSGLREVFINHCTEYFIDTKKLTWELDTIKEENKLLHDILQKSVKQKMEVQNRLNEDKAKKREKKKKKVRFDIP